MIEEKEILEKLKSAGPKDCGRLIKKIMKNKRKKEKKL